MRLPSRISQLQHVEERCLHLVEFMFPTRCSYRENQLGHADMEGPTLQKGVHNKFVQVLNIVTGNVVGVNDLVQGEQGNVIVIGKMCV